MFTRKGCASSQRRVEGRIHMHRRTQARTHAPAHTHPRTHTDRETHGLVQGQCGVVEGVDGA